MITMYWRIIGYSKVCSNVQDYRIKTWPWSQHSDPETYWSNKEEKLWCSRQASEYGKQKSQIAMI